MALRGRAYFRAMASPIRWFQTIATTLPVWLVACRAAPPIEAAVDQPESASGAGRSVAPSPPSPPTDEELADDLPPDVAPEPGKPGVHWIGVSCEPTARAAYHDEGSARFSFCLDVPDEWQAEDHSANGDGFLVIGPGPAVDIRAWGGWLLFSREEELDIYRGHGVMSDFRFSDGVVGKAFQEGREHRWIRLERDRIIGFAVTADDAWLKAHEARVLAMARSLRMGRQYMRKAAPVANPTPKADGTPM